MNRIYCMNRYTGISIQPVEGLHPDLVVKYFNQDYNHKDGVKFLISSHTLDRMVNYSVIQGVLDEIGGKGVNIKTMDDLNRSVLNKYDAFWDAVQERKDNSLLYCQSIIASYPRLRQAVCGPPVALMTRDDEVIGLKNVGYTEKVGGSYYVYYSDGIVQDKRLFRKTQKRCADDLESFKYHATSNIEIG